MSEQIKQGDAVEVKLGDSWLHHIFHSSDKEGVTVTRGGVTRKVAAENVRVPAAGASDSPTAETTEAKTYPVAAHQSLQRCDELEKDFEKFAEVAGKRMDVIEAANATIAPLTQRVEALEAKPTGPTAEDFQALTDLVNELKNALGGEVDRVRALEEKANWQPPAPATQAAPDPSVGTASEAPKA